MPVAIVLESGSSSLSDRDLRAVVFVILLQFARFGRTHGGSGFVRRPYDPFGDGRRLMARRSIGGSMAKVAVVHLAHE